MRIDYKKKQILAESEISPKELQLKLQEAALQLKVDRLATEQSLAAKERELALNKSTFPLNVAKVINLIQEVENLYNGLTAIDDLAEELGLRDEDLVINP